MPSDTPKPLPFTYNIDVADRIFASRQKTEELLAPEREIGLITPHDYDAAVNFLPGPHRYYPVRVPPLSLNITHTCYRP